MSMTIRGYEPGDRDAVFEALTAIYGDGQPVPAERELPAHRRHFVAIEADRCVGFYGLLEFPTLRGESVVPTGGIAMVGVRPEDRHRKIGSQLMRFAVNQMRSDGLLLASLYPFSEAYYRQFGYEVAGRKLKITCPTRLLPQVPMTLPIRRLSGTERNAIRPCHEAFASARSGIALRDDPLWDRLFGSNEEKTIYAAGDPVEAYIAVKHRVNFNDDQEIQEVVWSTWSGYEAVLGLIRNVAINKATVTWNEPADSPFLANHLIHIHPMSVTVNGTVMFRVLDVPGALKQLKPHGTGNFTVEIQDELVSENRGPWLVSYQNGQAEVEVVAGGTAQVDLSVSIQRFSQIFLGNPSLADHLRNGTLEISDPNARRAALQLFTDLPVYSLDHF